LRGRADRGDRLPAWPQQHRTTLDDLLNRSAQQFTDGALFADDALPTGRYDRYSNEYARAIYDAAELAGRRTS